MIRLTLLSFATAASLAGCGQQAPAPSPKHMSGTELAAERDRCRALGLKAYEDPGCKAAQQEREDRFLRKSGEPGP